MLTKLFAVLSQLGTFYILCIVVILAAICERLSKTRYLRRISSAVSPAVGLPFIGIAYQMIPNRKIFYTIGRYFDKLKSSTYCAWMGTHPVIFTVDPELIKHVLSSEDCIDKSRTIYASVSFVFLDGLVTSKEPKWRHNRKLLNLSFNYKILNSFIPDFNNAAKMTVKRFEKLVDQSEHHVHELLKEIGLIVASITTMGINGLDTDEHFMESLNYVIETLIQDTILTAMHMSFISRTPKLHRTIASVKKLIQDVVDKKVKEKRCNQTEDRVLKTASTNNIFIEQVLGFYKNGQLNMDDVISESITIIAGAFETTATTVYSVLVMLAMHPEVQEKLFDEVKSVYPDKNIDVEYDDLKNLPYLGMVVDETLRLLPSVPMIARQTKRDSKFKNNFILPKEAQIILPIYVLHRRKDLWGPNANAFDPENFLPENVAERHPYAYIPFSKGQRNCIGSRYAFISVRILLISLVRNFKFSTAMKYEELVLVENITLKYDVEPKLKLERREI